MTDKKHIDTKSLGHSSINFRKRFLAHAAFGCENQRAFVDQMFRRFFRPVEPAGGGRSSCRGTGRYERRYLDVTGGRGGGHQLPLSWCRLTSGERSRRSGHLVTWSGHLVTDHLALCQQDGRPKCHHGLIRRVSVGQETLWIGLASWQGTQGTEQAAGRGTGRRGHGRRCRTIFTGRWFLRRTRGGCCFLMIWTNLTFSGLDGSACLGRITLLVDLV